MRTIRLSLSILIAFTLAVYPLVFVSSSAYALELRKPSAPSAPSAPSEPESPESLFDQGTGTESSSSTSDSNESTDQTAEATASNSNTGDDSNNDSETAVSNETEVGIDNEANIDNIVDGEAVTGENNSDKNTGNGSVDTGSAAITGDVETSANTVNIGALECLTECSVVNISDLEASNSNTGANSENSADSSISNDDTFGIDNDANFNNYFMFDSNSGDNSTSYNTGNGTTTTGDADIILTAINAANNINVGYDVFNIYDDQTGDLVIDFDAISAATGSGGGIFGSSNDTTGANSSNDASANQDNSSTILIDNNGNMINNYYLDANTGNNTADKNTGDGSIATGDANAALNLINFFNNVMLGSGELLLGVVNIFGSLSGDIVLSGLNGPGGTSGSGLNIGSANNTTGSGSSNDAESSVSNNTNLSVDNFADVLNNVTLDANTGENTAEKNTGSGSINSGNTDVNLNLANIANNTVAGGGGDIWMVLVNNLGTWTGQLFDTTGTGGAYSPFFTFSLNPDGTMSAQNQNTGADSSNNGQTSVEDETDISIVNSGTLTNNVMIDANTGNNSASKNTGSGSIATGDANISANIINILNNVFLGGRFAITIVNIFGTFTGDIYEGEVGSIKVSENDSIAIGPGAGNNSGNNMGSPQSPLYFGSNVGPLGSEAPSEDGQSDNSDTSLVLGSSNDKETLPISRFGAARGLFDDFKLWYLLFPVIFGTAFSLSRRAMKFKEVKI